MSNLFFKSFFFFLVFIYLFVLLNMKSTVKNGTCVGDVVRGDMRAFAIDQWPPERMRDLFLFSTFLSLLLRAFGSTFDCFRLSKLTTQHKKRRARPWA